MKEGVDSRVTFQRERDSLINCDDHGKNSHELSFNFRLGYGCGSRFGGECSC